MRGSCIAGFWTRGFSTIYMGKPVASRFGQMVRRIQDWLILIPFGNRVYHLPKSVSFNEKRPRKPETNIQKRFEDMKSEFPPGIFQQGKYANAFSDVPFVSGIFHWNVENNPKLSYLVVSLAKHQSVLLVCFNGSYIESCSSFMIHTRCHTSI